MMTVHLILSDKEFGLWHVAQIIDRYVHAPVAWVSVASRGPQFLYQYYYEYPNNPNSI